MKQYNNGTVIQPAQWDAIRVPANATRINPVTSKPDYGVFRGNLRTFLFDPNTDEAVTFTVQLPHGYKYGTDLCGYVHWSPMTAPTNGQVVTWFFEYSIAEVGSVFPAPTTAGPGQHTFASNSQYEHIFTDIGDISGLGLDSLSATIQMRIGRDTSDTYTGDVALHEFDLHYQIDQPGSRQELVK